MLRGFKSVIAVTACIVCCAKLDAQTVQSPPDNVVTPPPVLGAGGESVEPSPDFQPKWVWSADAVNDGTELFIRQRFTLAQKPKFARLEITVDNEFAVELNGHSVFYDRDTDWTSPEVRDGVQDWLHVGNNEVVIKATNLDGPAGAIALIRVVDTNGITFVGTSDNSETSMDKISWSKAKSLGDQFAEPWKLVSAESKPQKLARQEAWRLVGEIEGPSIEASARAIVYLAYLGVEFFDTDFDEPVISISGNAPTTSILKKAIEVIRTNLYSNASAKRNAAINAVSYVLTSEDSVELLVDQIQGDFAICGKYGNNLQLAILSQIKTLLESDKQAVDVAKQAVETKTVERKNKIAELKGKQAEIATNEETLQELTREIVTILPAKKMELNAEMQALATERDGTPMPTDDRKREIEQQTKEIETKIARADAEMARLTEQRNIKLSESASLLSALALLSKQLEVIEVKVLDLKGKLDGVFATAVMRLEEFEKLVGGSNNIFSGILHSISQQTLDQFRKLRFAYAGISSYADADTFFATAAATGTYSTSQPGARTSAADLPGVADRTVGERPGVSETAPFDPSLSPRARTVYPSTDDRGQRKQQDNSKIPESKVEKAPGATGAVFVRSKK